MELIVTISHLLSEPWVWLILLASVMYGLGNYVDELLLSKYEQEVGTLVIISSLFGLIIASIFFWFGILNQIAFFADTPLLLKALFIGFLEILWVIPYLYATERSGAIIAGPLFQMVPVFALAIEYFYGVIPPAVQILGALIIVSGGVILSIEKEEDEDGEETTILNWGTLGLMMLSAVTVSIIYVLFKDAALESNFVTVGYWTGIGMFLTGLVIYLFWKPYRDQFNSFAGNANFKAIGIQAGNEILDAGGVYLTHLANTLGPSVMVVTAFNATQPIAVGIIGWVLTYFGISSVSSESTNKHGWILIVIGILLVAAGVVILAVGGQTL